MIDGPQPTSGGVLGWGEGSVCKVGPPPPAPRVSVGGNPRYLPRLLSSPNMAAAFKGCRGGDEGMEAQCFVGVDALQTASNHLATNSKQMRDKRTFKVTTSKKSQ